MTNASVSHPPHRRGWLNAIAFVAGLIIAPGAMAGTVVRAGPDFRIHAHGLGASAAEKALDACEAAAEAWRTFDDVRLPGPLDVHLYRARADYEAADRRLNGGALNENGAFANSRDMSAHVWLQPPVSDQVLDEFGLPLLSRRLLIHEATHLLRYASFESHRLHPHWFANSLSLLVSEFALKDRGWIDAAERDPGFSTKILRAQRLRSTGKLPTIDDLFDDHLESLEFYDRYAVHWLFVRHLQAAGVWTGIFADAKRLDGARAFPDMLARAVRKRLAAAGITDAQFTAYIAGLKPQWDESARAMNASGDAWIQSAFPDADAECWSRNGARAGRELRGSVRILTGPSAQARIMFANPGGDCHAFALSPASGAALLRRAPGKRDWTEIKRTPCAAIAANRDIPIEARIGAGELELIIEGRSVMKLGVSKDWSGSWGLGTNRNSTSVWRDVTTNDGARR